MMAPRTDTIFRALGDPTRLAIMERLRGGEITAGDLAAGFRMSRPAVSRHVRVLRRARLVNQRRVGRNRVYALAPEPLRVVDEWLASYRRFWKSRLQELKRHAETAANETSTND
jgi:DNA-binding transcriptional ArsR family regulator